MTNSAQSVINWPQVLEQNRSWLTKVLRARIGDRHDVEDVYQEIVLAVLRQVQRSLDSIGLGEPRSQPARSMAEATSNIVPTEPEKVAPWLYRIAIRHVVNFYRRTNRLSHAKPSADLEPPTQAPQPLDWMLAVEKKEHLDSALEDLRPQDLEVLTLKYNENWSYQQIADHLGVPVRNIEYRLLNARKHLRNNLTRAGVEATDVPIRLANK
ncbi:MAG: RNA polymerase sigma factor [Planctomycetota bacterium]